MGLQAKQFGSEKYAIQDHTTEMALISLGARTNWKVGLSIEHHTTRRNQVLFKFSPVLHVHFLHNMFWRSCFGHTKETQFYEYEQRFTKCIISNIIQFLPWWQAVRLLEKMPDGSVQLVSNCDGNPMGELMRDGTMLADSPCDQLEHMLNVQLDQN